MMKKREIKVFFKRNSSEKNIKNRRKNERIG